MPEPFALPLPPDESGGYFKTITEAFQPLQAIAQIPGVAIGGAVGYLGYAHADLLAEPLVRFLGLGDSPWITEMREQVGGAYGRALEESASATLGRPYKAGELPRTFSESIDIWRALPGPFDVITETVSPGRPKTAVGALAKFGVALLGNILTDPLNAVAKPLGLMDDATRRLGMPRAYYQFAKDKNVVKAAGTLLGSPIMMAAYAPEIVTGAWEGMKLGFEGAAEGNWDKMVGGFGQAGLTGTLGYLGARGVIAERTATRTVRQVLKWEQSPVRQRLYNEALEAWKHKPVAEVDLAFKAFIDPSIGTFMREHEGALPEYSKLRFLSEAAAKKAGMLPPSPGALESPAYDRTKGFPEAGPLEEPGLPKAGPLEPPPAEAPPAPERMPWELPPSTLEASPVVRARVENRLRELIRKQAQATRNIQALRVKIEAAPEGDTRTALLNTLAYFEKALVEIRLEAGDIRAGKVTHLLQEKLPGEKPPLPWEGLIDERLGVDEADLAVTRPLADPEVSGVVVGADYVESVLRTAQRAYDKHTVGPKSDWGLTVIPVPEHQGYWVVYMRKGSILAAGSARRHPDGRLVIDDMAKVTKALDSEWYTKALGTHGEPAPAGGPGALRENATFAARVVRGKLHELGAIQDKMWASPDAIKAEQWYQANKAAVVDAAGAEEALGASLADSMSTPGSLSSLPREYREKLLAAEPRVISGEEFAFEKIREGNPEPNVLEGIEAAWEARDVETLKVILEDRSVPNRTRHGVADLLSIIEPPLKPVAPSSIAKFPPPPPSVGEKAEETAWRTDLGRWVKPRYWFPVPEDLAPAKVSTEISQTPHAIAYDKRGMQATLKRVEEMKKDYQRSFDYAKDPSRSEEWARALANLDSYAASIQAPDPPMPATVFTPEFRKEFGRTKWRDPENPALPRLTWRGIHVRAGKWTPSGERTWPREIRGFRESKTSFGGHHAGATRAQALDILNARGVVGCFEGACMAIPGFVNVKNPVVVDFDFSFGDPYRSAKEMVEAGAITQEQQKALHERWTLHAGRDTSKKNWDVAHQLWKNGYDGIIYRNQYEGTAGDPSNQAVIFFGSHQFKSILNKGTWNHSRDMLRQASKDPADPPKGFYLPGERVIVAMENADFTTMVHEFAHAITPELHLMMHPRVFRRLLAWAGRDPDGNFTREGMEKVARGVERYALEGKAPLPYLQPVFETVRRMMIGVYQSDDVRGLVRINDNVRRAFNQMLGGPKVGIVKGGGTALDKIVQQEDPQLVLRYQHGREAQMLGLLDEVLKKIFTETGEVAVPGRGTIHDRLQFLAEAGVTPEEVSDMLGGKLTPEQIADFTIGVSQLGRRMEDLSKVRQKQAQIQREFLKSAKEDPAFMEFWNRWNAERIYDDDDVRGALADRKLWAAAVRGQGAVSNFARAMIAGTAQVAVYNTLNALTHYGLFGLTTTYRYYEAKLRGQSDEVIRQRETLKGWDKSLLFSMGNLLGEIGDKVRKPFSLAPRTGKKPFAKDLISLIGEYGNKELVKQLLHRGDADMPAMAAPKRPRGLEGIVSLALDLNLMADRFARLAVIGAYGNHLLGRYGVKNWRELGEVARLNPQAQKDIANMVQYGSQLALRASGGLTAPKGSIGAELIRAFTRIPLAWTVMPFPRFMFGTFMPVVVESFPVINKMFSKRVQNSLQYPALQQEIAQRKVELKVMTSDLVLLQRKQSYLTGDQLARYNSLVEKGTNVGILKRMAAVQFAEIQALKRETRQMRMDGLYEPAQVRAHAISGPFMIAAFLALRLARGDDGTNYNQIKEEDGSAVNLDQHLGPFGIYALIGDVVAHGLLGTKKYEGEPGFAQFKPWYEALTNQRYGGARLSDMFESDRVTWESALRTVQRMSGEVGRMIGTGAWPMDIARRVDEIVNEQARYKRRFDAPIAGTVPRAIGEGLLRGAASEIPGLREQLPISYEAATGKPYERSAPVRSLISVVPNLQGSWDQLLGSLLSGNRERLTPVTEFINSNQALLSGGDLMPTRTEVPEFDERVSKNFGKLVEKLVIPQMGALEALPRRDLKARRFTDLMRRARTMAEFQAELETFGKKGQFPMGRKRAARERIMRQLMGKFPQTIPSPPEHGWMNYLLLPPSPGTDEPF